MTGYIKSKKEKNTCIRKDDFWQLIRGVCILAVIMIHCPTGLNFSPIDTYAWLILRQFINFPVALFVFMAGYFVNAEKVKKNVRTYVFKRGGRLILPYLVWSSLYLIKESVLGSNVTVKRLISVYCTGGASTPYYYIIVLAQLTILTLWLVKRKKLGLLYFVTPIYLGFIYAYHLTTGKAPRFYETFFPAWFIFYLLGMDCRAGNWANAIKRTWKWIIFAAVSISICEAFMLLSLGCDISFASSQIKISSFLYAIVIALALMKIKDKEPGKTIAGRLLISVGDCSYGIFYTHMFVLNVAKRIVSKTMISEVWGLDFLFCFVIAACGSYLIVLNTKMLAKKLGIERGLVIIGF